MPGLSKLILIVLVGLAGWLGWRMLQKIKRQGGNLPTAGAKRGEGAAQGDVEEMVACRVCGTYLARGKARNCGRSDCPH